MIIIKPEVEGFNDINVVDDPTLYWGEGQSYTEYDERRYGNFVYRCIKDVTGTKPPPPDDPMNWEYLYTVNEAGCIDHHSSTRTVWDNDTADDTSDDGLIFDFNNDGFNVIGFVDYYGNEIIVDIYDDSDALRYSKTITRYQRPNARTWYNYYFDNFSNSTTALAWMEVPKYNDGYIKVTITKNDGVAWLGQIIAGTWKYGGETVYPVTPGYQSLSKTSVTRSGVTILEAVMPSRTLFVNVIFNASHLPMIDDNVGMIVGDVALFIGDESKGSIFGGFGVFGVCESFSSDTRNKIRNSGKYTIKEVT